MSYTPYPYPVVPPSSESIVNVSYLCDTTTDNGGCIVIQVRTKSDTDFYLGWDDYKNGFGSLSGDFWLGLEHIHEITSSGSYELRVDLVYQDKSAYARYSPFSVTDEADNYRLNIGDYSGSACDSLRGDSHSPFTTKDRDNDDHSKSCARI